MFTVLNIFTYLLKVNKILKCNKSGSGFQQLSTKVKANNLIKESRLVHYCIIESSSRCYSRS